MEDSERAGRWVILWVSAGRANDVQVDEDRTSRCVDVEDRIGRSSK